MSPGKINVFEPSELVSRACFTSLLRVCCLTLAFSRLSSVDYECEIFSILSGARALTSVVLAGKRIAFVILVRVLAVIESFRFLDEYDNKYDIFSILSSARA